MKKLSHSLLFISIFYFSAAAFAYDPQGHQLVGAIADQLIKGTQAQQEVNTILGNQSLSNVAVWADCAKGVRSADDVNFNYSENLKLFPECAVFSLPDDKERFESYVKRNWKQCGTAHGKEYCHNQYHYADVSTLESSYKDTYVGTSNHDIVHAINAAIAVLQNKVPDSPFSIADKKEALMLLAHYLGDIHQPLHVEAIYLDAQGQAVNPDVIGYNANNDTAGGNNIKIGAKNLHHEWDQIPPGLLVVASDGSKMVNENLMLAAKNIAATPGDIQTWSTSWANDTISLGKKVFDQLSFTQKSASHNWKAQGVDDVYQTKANQIKTDELAKAGARLAQVLTSIWPATTEANSSGYLSQTELLHVNLWLPPVPASNSDMDKLDIKNFYATRALLNLPRGQQAAEDDVYDPEAVLTRFQNETGKVLTQQTAPTLMVLIKKLETDTETILHPVKKQVVKGGRVRPFVAYPASKNCLEPVDMAGHRDTDFKFHLKESGAYPSTHASIGMIVAMVLSESLPEKTDALLQRGIEFGESRVICGFHYPSDVVAGRLVAAALFARVHADPEFIKDMAAAKQEINLLQ